MQVVDDREGRLRNSLVRLEDEDGLICRETLVSLVTVAALQQVHCASAEFHCRPRGRCS